MATAAVTNTLVDATTITVNPLNTNFADLVAFLNTDVVHVDGSKAMSGNLDLSGNDIVNADAITATGLVTAEDVTINDDLTVTGEILAANGAAATPSVAFASDTNLGIYRAAADELGVAAGGAERAKVTSTELDLSVPILLQGVAATTVQAYAFDPTTSMATTTQRAMIGGTFFLAYRSGAASLFLGRNTSDGNIAEFYRSGSAVGSISVTTTATAFNTSSDGRKKTSVIDTNKGLATVLSVRARDFMWKETGAFDTGFVAQEVQPFVPQAVTVGEDGFLQLDYSKLVPFLWGAVQELHERILELESEMGR